MNEPLMLLPGMMCDARIVTPQTEYFSATRTIVCPVTMHEEMQEIIPSATLAVIAGAGHMPTLEQPEKTNEALEVWLNQ